MVKLETWLKLVIFVQSTLPPLTVLYFIFGTGVPFGIKMR